jgi:uncharacterized protein
MPTNRHFITPLICCFALALALNAGVARASNLDSSGIAWQDWSDELFERAARENRFVILDLEAVWCHWCHVMEAETYSKQPIIDFIGEHYIAVRVDQDANPDISSRYGDWGWPATIVFGPDGSEIVKRRGYIPAPMMLSMLQAIVDDPSPGPSVRAALKIVPGEPGQLSAAQREQLEGDYWRVYDPEFGGWGNVHKYLDAPTIEYAMTRAARGDRFYELVARQSLSQALRLLDPEWGGMYQYSDKLDWSSPHYEKIMSKQADALRIFSLAHGLWGKAEPRYLAGASKAYEYLTTRMMASNGAFYTSQDADLNAAMDGEEFYALKSAERDALGKVPRIDKNHYSQENGWVISALVAYYDATGELGAIDHAKRAARWVMNNRALPDGGFSHSETDRGGPFLGDTLAMAGAFVALHGSTGERQWLDHAERAVAFIDANFRSREAGYVSHPVPPNAKGAFAQELRDVDVNVAAARVALRVHWYSGQDRFKDVAKRTMSYLGSNSLIDNRYFLHGVLLVDHEMVNDPVHVTVVGAKDDPTAQALHRAARTWPAVARRLDWWDKSEGPLPNEDVTYPELDRAAAFVCTNRSCSLPIFEVDKVGATIARLSKPTE